MSKYLYPTVYELFTGTKPPEPEEKKIKKKRPYGHPYRFRHSAKKKYYDQTEIRKNEIISNRCEAENKEEFILLKHRRVSRYDAGNYPQQSNLFDKTLRINKNKN